MVNHAVACRWGEAPWVRNPATGRRASAIAAWATQEGAAAAAAPGQAATGAETLRYHRLLPGSVRRLPARARRRRGAPNRRSRDRSPSVSFRSEEHTSELQSLIRILYPVFCLKKKK